MDHVLRARELFLEGRSCSQAVFTAFSDVTGLSEEDSLRISSSFGGGIGGMRETCGAVSAMAMVCGCVCGYTSCDDNEEKKRHYATVRSMIEKFKELNETVVCRELLRGIKTSPIPSVRNEEYYKVRPCVKFVEDAARILDETLFSEV